MPQLNSLTFTRTLTAGETLEIDASYGFKSITVEVITGTGTITGTGKAGAVSSNALNLTLGRSWSGVKNTPFHKLYIVAGAGSTLEVTANQD